MFQPYLPIFTQMFTFWNHHTALDLKSIYYHVTALSLFKLKYVCLRTKLSYWSAIFSFCGIYVCAPFIYLFSLAGSILINVTFFRLNHEVLHCCHVCNSSFINNTSDMMFRLFMIYHHTKFHMPSFNGSLDTPLNQMIQKHFTRLPHWYLTFLVLKKSSIFIKDLSYIVSGI
jgi:hypothetical protein